MSDRVKETDSADRTSALRNGRYRPWALAAFLAIACGALYLAVRPSLYDGDGYRYRLFALDPSRFYNIDAHHLLWIPVQILLAAVAESLGHPTTVPFQIAGIVINCIALFFFCALLSETSGSQLFAMAGVLFVAFSPQFWHLGSQNQPYPLVFLAFVLYLQAWHTEDGEPPSGLRLVSAGLCLSVAIFLHQAAVVLVPAGCAGLMIFGREAPRRRLIRAVVWGAGIATIILPIYLLLWATTTGEALGFSRWATAALDEVHPIQFQFPMTLVQTVMGVAGSLVQTNPIQDFLERNASPKAVLALYGGLAIASCVGMAALARRTGVSRQLIPLIRTNALVAVSLLSIVFWSAILIVWEPATSYYWVLNFFPALVCLGLVFRDRAWHGLPVFTAIALVLIGWNGYFNREFDRFSSRNFPEPLVASIQQHLGDRDIFIALGHEDWYGDMNYELLFNCLERLPRNPGVTILNDYVFRAQGSRSWREKLRDRIDSTLNSGGRVFVAAHVLDENTYTDLAGTQDPYNAFVLPAYETLDGPALYKRLNQLFKRYTLSKSDFKIGLDPYFEIQRSASNSASGSQVDPTVSNSPAAGQPLGAMTVAITVDDLPVHGDLVGDLDRTKIAQAVIDAFKKNGVKQAYGFCNGFDPNHPDEKRVYATWLKAGYPLGNHTYDHIDLKASTVREYIANIEKMDQTLQTFAPISGPIAERRVFRYPYLSEGETLEKRNAVRSYLARHGYRIAQVSFTYDDWAWNEAYTRCVSRDDDKSIAWLKQHIVDDAERRLRSADAIARLLFGRSIKHILLLHIGAFDAVMLDAILRDWKSKGVTFTTFDDAISDPAYRFNPNYAYYGELTFLEQTVDARKVDVSALDDNTYTVDGLEKMCPAKAQR